MDAATQILGTGYPEVLKTPYGMLLVRKVILCVIILNKHLRYKIKSCGYYPLQNKRQVIRRWTTSFRILLRE